MAIAPNTPARIPCQSPAPLSGGPPSTRAGKPDQSGRQCCGDQKSEDRKDLSDDAYIVGDKLGAGSDKTAGHLGDKQAEQSEEGIAVDIAGDEAQQRRHPSRQRHFPRRRGFGHIRSPRA
jgi:hypothetical protein